MGERRKRLLVDLDGCVVDSYGQRICDAACSLYGLSLKPEDFKEYTLTEGTGLTSEQITGIFNMPGYYRDPLPFPHAIEVLQQLFRDGFEQHIITARPGDDVTRADTLRWVADHNMPFDSLTIVANHGDHLLTADTKLRIASRLDAGYAIEDNPFNAAAYAQVCDVVFLVDNAINRNVPLASNVVRINDFRDVAAYLRDDERSTAPTSSVEH